MDHKQIEKSVDDFLKNPIHRLIFERLGEIDGDGPIDWDYVKTGKRK